MLIGIIVLVVAVVVALWISGSYNSLVEVRNKVDEAFATMDVYLKKRWDLIPNLVETTKGYAKHEQETFSKIVGLRSSNYSTMTQEQKLDVNQQLSAAIPKIFALAEAYPELKADANFRQLSEALNEVENDIANARKYYNAVVLVNNNKVQFFPSNIVAGIFHFTTKPMFEIAAAERENVQVKF
jgi:LemA protein